MNPTPVTIDLDLGDKPAIAQVQEFKGAYYLCLRYMYTDYKTGEVKHSKNGINIPLQDAYPAIEALAEAYQQATGETLCIMPDLSNEE